MAFWICNIFSGPGSSNGAERTWFILYVVKGMSSSWS